MRKNTLISGASAGLGAGMARILAAQGHNLALTARRVERLEELKAELEAAHPGITVTAHRMDVNDADSVFAGFADAIAAHGHLDRVIVNAGLGKGARIGTGGFKANSETVVTNVLGALAQCEAAMEHFYERKSGHLVMISSVSAMRGMPSTMATYAATKRMVAHLAEGIRMDLVGRKGLDIAVTTIYPGYIESEMNDMAEQQSPLIVRTEEGCQAMVKAIVKEVEEASVPAWPWVPIGGILKVAPRAVVRKLV